MRTPLRLCFALFLAFIVQGYSFAQTVTTTLGGLTDVKTGITEDFTVTTQGSGQVVRGKFTFSPFVANDIILQYQAPGTTQYTNLTVGADGVVYFGPEAGFTLSTTAVNHSFKILFNTARNYNYTLELVTVGASPQTVATANGTLSVSTLQEPTINSTLDQITTALETGQNIEWQILADANDRAGDKVNIEIALNDPAQRNNFTMEYDVNRAIMNPGQTVDFQPLTFGADGIAKIGPEGGETLTTIENNPDINQIMRIRFTQPGTYSYTIRLRRDDDNIIAFVNETVTVTGVAGIGDMIGSTRIRVYPTLTNGAVRVDLGDVRNASISVSDMLGRVVMQLENAAGAVNLETHRLAKGTYFVKVVKGNDVAGSRFIVR